MSLLSIQDKQMTITAVEYFLSTLKTQNVKDEQRIQAYTQLLSWLKMDLSKHMM
jgi:DNA/RNA-binding domain of Phe-tRNA-synthetase-like protein